MLKSDEAPHSLLLDSLRGLCFLTDVRQNTWLTDTLLLFLPLCQGWICLRGPRRDCLWGNFFLRSFRTWRTGAAGYGQDVRGAGCVWLTLAPALWANTDAALGRKSGEVLHVEGIIHDYSSINRRRGWKRICGLLCFVFTPPFAPFSGWSPRYVSQLLCWIATFFFSLPLLP